MKVTVKYFASIREAIGVSSESVATTAATLAVLRDELIAPGWRPRREPGARPRRAHGPQPGDER